MITNKNQVYHTGLQILYHQVHSFTEVTQRWEGNIIPMNTDRCSVYKYFVSLRNKRQKWVSLLLKIGKKSDLPRSNQNKFNRVLDIELYLLIRNTPTQT